jgi:5'-phosphate synthase pdxT subunit
MTAQQPAAAGAGVPSSSAAAAAAAPHSSSSVRVGVLALQGSFREHMALLSKIDGVDVVEVRTKDELDGLSGLVIPGGESTTMAHIADRWGLIPELQAFAKRGRPIWGTCAGMIFLAERAEGEWTVGAGGLGEQGRLVDRVV